MTVQKVLFAPTLLAISHACVMKDMMVMALLVWVSIMAKDLENVTTSIIFIFLLHTFFMGKKTSAWL